MTRYFNGAEARDMSDEQVQRSIDLQRAISNRLAELAFADHNRAERISRQLAEVATRGKSFADHTIPLFLQIRRENTASVTQVALAIKVQLQELSDTLNDLRQDLEDWTDFFHPDSS
jgi:hypothetical protein